MAEKRCKVTFEPEGRSVYVLSGTTLYEATGEAGIIIKSECGGAGTCGNCKVVVISGDFEESGSDRFLNEKEMKAGAVLACRTKVKSDMMIEIPLSSRLFEQKILTEGLDTHLKLSPNVQKIYLTVEKPTLEDPRSDLDRIWDGLKNISSDPQVPIDILRRLPEKLRKDDYSVTIVLNADEIVGIETGDKSATNYGVAFDIGTTTVVGYLHELNTGKQLSVASRTNPQTSYGDDVITRINHTNTAKDGLNDLHVRIISCMNEIIDELADDAGIETKFIYEITTTGNTTMNHLFLKLNPKYIALNPYVGVMRSNIDVRAKEIGININRYGKVHSMPSIAGFVGGDTVAVILASEMHKSDKLQFAIDIGTNGELVMGNRDRIVACSTAAGPAFEGARITHGMRASDGAIEKVIITDEDVEINTIGGAKPIGMCGTALIDSIAELRKRNIITTTGKMLKRDEIPDTVPDFIRERVIDHEKYRTSFILVPGSKSQTGNDILITQKDVRETQLAKGAIFAGYQILKSILCVTDDDIQEVLLAGAFGNYIRKEQAKWTGLLPDIPSEKIQFIGNAAGTGAKMVLLSKELRAEAAEISRNTEYIELAVSLDFQKVFTDSMFFPECLTCE
ncbi:MAG TPA: DUF4445 domain-containing protein [Spirochaetes bacterium]|nr:DUF4445 domain-containing protein [Spirochaetota bacterium]